MTASPPPTQASYWRCPLTLRSHGFIFRLKPSPESCNCRWQRFSIRTHPEGSVLPPLTRGGGPPLSPSISHSRAVASSGARFAPPLRQMGRSLFPSPAEEKTSLRPL